VALLVLKPPARRLAHRKHVQAEALRRSRFSGSGDPVDYNQAGVS